MKILPFPPPVLLLCHKIKHSIRLDMVMHLCNPALDEDSCPKDNLARRILRHGFMNKENNVYLLLPNQTETICIDHDILIHCKKSIKFNLNGSNILECSRHTAGPARWQTLWNDDFPKTLLAKGSWRSSHSTVCKK